MKGRGVRSKGEVWAWGGRGDSGDEEESEVEA